MTVSKQGSTQVAGLDIVGWIRISGHWRTDFPCYKLITIGL